MGRVTTPTTTIGLIGVGRIGMMHAANLSEMPDDIRLVITDTDRDRTLEAARALGCEAASDAEEIFASGPDGIIIAVGTAHHAPLVLRSIRSGVPCFCEKPVAESVAASLPLLKEVEEHGAAVQIGHQRRFDRGYKEAKRAYESGELGWLHTIRALTGDVTPPPIRFLESSGGLFRDVSVHDFDIIQWITGQHIVEVYARGSNQGDPAIRDAGDVDSGVAVATLEDGTVASVSATRYNGAGHDVRMELQGSAETVHVGLDSSYAGRSAEADFKYPIGTRHQTFHERFAAAYKEEMQAFVELIHGERENPCTPQEAVDASRVADAAQLSVDTGEPQRVIR